MGEVLHHLASQDLTIPAGLSGWPGLGFVLTGGMGPLTRRYGLAIDRLLQIRGAWGKSTRHRDGDRLPRVSLSRGTSR